MHPDEVSVGCDDAFMDKNNKISLIGKITSDLHRLATVYIASESPPEGLI